MPSIACLNGVFGAPETTCVPIDDRGFIFGDGVYETMRAYGGRIWALDRHLVRLEGSLREVAIPSDSMPAIRGWIEEAMDRSSLQEALVYAQVTRGVAPRVHTFSSRLVPSVLVTVRPTEAIALSVREAGVTAITVEDQRWARRDIKSINLLPNVLAKQQALDAGAFEAVLVEPDGRVTEGSTTNLFAVFGKELWTAPADHHILGGITRDLVLGLACKLSIPVREEPFSLEQLRKADEIFFSGTTAEVLGVSRLDGAAVGSGKVGAITWQLYEAFRACVRGECDGLEAFG